MNGMKRTAVPLPASKPKPKAKDSPPKAQLSQEFIDSDDDSPSESTAQPKGVAKPKPTMAIHVNGVPRPKPKASKKNGATPQSMSKSISSPKKPAPKQIVTEEQVAELSSSEVTDEDVPARDIQTKLPGNKGRKHVSSDSSSDGSSASSDESDTGHARHPSRKLAQPQEEQAPVQTHAVAFQPTKSYVPPRGFNIVPVNDRTVSKSSGLFDNLQGKQIWHMTIPAGVSVKDLGQLNMDKAMAGKPVLRYKGADYGLFQTEKSEDSTSAVFVPRKDSVEAISTPISQTLRLRTIVQLPQLSSKQADKYTGSEAAGSITRSTIRAPRPQVTGLKMRFLPIGFGGGEGGVLGSSDDETEAPRETAGLGMPDELNLPSRKPKRKHGDVHGMDTSEAPSKKTKKHRDPQEDKRKAEKRARKEKKRAQEAASAKS
ncbi:hypothetical protein BDW02DRAFT_563606 [Decorospora gaudefroyi]|uniref:DNA-directed RNA polymerase I subunit RPA34.5 n=1 Tax=Decorospora gaudefroyi TaxID=184978 RepID=A0A6A5KW02_9PLEO|nr:hypothetical protein BDW02DRAFT_563606 [Decorospora gaudefroyi]